VWVTRDGLNSVRTRDEPGKQDAAPPGRGDDEELIFQRCGQAYNNLSRVPKEARLGWLSPTELRAVRRMVTEDARLAVSHSGVRMVAALALAGISGFVALRIGAASVFYLPAASVTIFAAMAFVLKGWRVAVALRLRGAMLRTLGDWDR